MAAGARASYFIIGSMVFTKTISGRLQRCRVAVLLVKCIIIRDHPEDSPPLLGGIFAGVVFSVIEFSLITVVACHCNMVTNRGEVMK